jgi:hypothetical protein
MRDVTLWQMIVIAFVITFLISIVVGGIGEWNRGNIGRQRERNALELEFISRCTASCTTAGMRTKRADGRRCECEVTPCASSTTSSP